MKSEWGCLFQKGSNFSGTSSLKIEYERNEGDSSSLMQQRVFENYVPGLVQEGCIF